jgi:hypothetical protein
MLRLELLKVKADLERELGQLVLDCSCCARRCTGLPVLESRQATGHREPTPHG